MALQALCPAGAPAMLQFRLPGSPEAARIVAATKRPLQVGTAGRYDFGSLQLVLPGAPGGSLFHGTGTLVLEEHTAGAAPRMRGRLQATDLRSPLGDADVSVTLTFDVPRACAADR